MGFSENIFVQIDKYHMNTHSEPLIHSNTLTSHVNNNRIWDDDAALGTVKRV